MIEVETPQEIEVISNGIDVEARSLDVEVVDLKELDVTVAKKEFVITGDDIYVPKLYDDAPQWMKDLVQLVVNSAVDTGNASTLAQLTSMLSQFATSYVPLNQYTQSILDLSNADASIHAVIETLNSNYNDGLNQANAQILDIQNTKASKDEVVTQVVNTLAAQLANPTSSLGAAIGNLQQTVVDNQNANALSMQTLTASLEDVSGDVSANSSAITGLQTNVSSINGTLTSQAGQITNLRSDLTSGTGTWLTGDTNVTNTVKSYTDGKVTGVESKWAYNSSLTINGTSYNSGFGLSNSAGTGAGSEFWINADKLKFTNNGKTGSKAPFTIEANGSTPQVTFNGIVSFSNVSNTQGNGTNLLYNSAPKIGNETKGWSIGWSNHGLSSSINAGFDPWRPTGGASVYVVVPGNPGIGTVFDINNSRFPVVAGARYEASAYVSSHRCNSWVTLAWFDSNGNYINESTGTSNGNASSGPLANWSRSTMFATAPSNAATAQFYVRSSVTSDNPYCFVAYAYAGVASANQTIASNWSEGSSAGVSSSDVVNDINNGQTTTINGGKITTGSIGANQIAVGSITADRINTGGLIAENINASSSIQGNSIYGSYIEGAYISGAVIHASYLDLNGELTVMTDWSSNVQLGYSFPVVVNGITSYKLNTVSSIVDSDGVSCSPTPGSPSHIVNLYGSNYTVYDSGSIFLNDGGLYSYDSYSTNTSLRARRVRPTISFPDTSAIVVGGSSVGQGSKTVDIYLFGVYFGRAVLNNTYGSTSASFAGYSGNTTFSLYGITFKLEHYWYEVPNPSGWPARISYAGLSIVAGTYTITFDWINQSPLCKYILLSSSTSAGAFPAFSINNM